MEVLSTDPNMPGFLANPENVEGGKRSVLVPKGKSLFTRQDSRYLPRHRRGWARNASSPGEQQRPSRMSHKNGGIKSAAVAGYHKMMLRKLTSTI